MWSVWVVVLAASTPETSQTTAAPKVVAREALAVMPVSAPALSEETRRGLTAALAYSAADLGPYNVLSPADTEAQLGRERMQQIAGCAPEASECVAEIVGALGTRLLLATQVARFGGKLHVNISLVDTRDQNVLGRGKGESRDDEGLYADAVDAAIRDLFDLAPKPRSEIDFGGAIRLPPAMELPAQGGAAIDIDMEKLLDAALDTQESTTAGPGDKAKAWCALADLRRGRHPLAKRAAQACERWRSYARELTERDAKLTKGYALLRDYVLLKRKSKEQKLAVVDDFLRSFGGLERNEVVQARGVRDLLKNGDGSVYPLDRGACREACIRSGLCHAGEFVCVSGPEDAVAAQWRAEGRESAAAAAWAELAATLPKPITVFAKESRLGGQGKDTGRFELRAETKLSREGSACVLRCREVSAEVNCGGGTCEDKEVNGFVDLRQAASAEASLHQQDTAPGLYYALDDPRVVLVAVLGASTHEARWRETVRERSPRWPDRNIDHSEATAATSCAFYARSEDPSARERLLGLAEAFRRLATACGVGAVYPVRDDTSAKR